MWKKVSIQIILLLLSIFLILFTYKIYFKSEKNTIANKNNTSQEESRINIDNLELEKKDENSNLVKDLKYISKDIMGNEYIITSKYSEINLENASMINMQDVSAKITMLNKKPFFVNSKYATYNNINYETTFFNKVEINYLDNIINSEKFAISIANNFAKVSENVIYQNKDVKLEADTIEIDLITKNSKIFMTEKNKKITIINKKKSGNN